MFSFSTLKMFGVVVLLVFANLANAAEASRFSCSLWVSPLSRGLFFNSGTFVTKGPVIMTVPECVDKETGLYGNLFLIAPIGDFDTGKEIDVRFGRRFKAGGLDIDASVANYYFGVGSGSMWDSANGRVRISRTFDLGGGNTIEPYGYADFQRNLTPLHANAFALAGGVVVNSRLDGLPGKPTLGTDVGVWKNTNAWTPQKGPVAALQLSLGYQVNKSVTAGPRFMETWGNVVDSNGKPSNMWGMYAVIKLN